MDEVTGENFDEYMAKKYFRMNIVLKGPSIQNELASFRGRNVDLKIFLGLTINLDYYMDECREVYRLKTVRIIVIEPSYF